MAKYKVQGPDGAIHLFEGPDNATPDQITAFAAQTFGKKAPPTASDADKELYGPLKDSGPVDKLIAGYGSAGARTMRGIGQRLGLISQQEVDERGKLDAPLLADSWGAAGNIAGNVANAVPTVAIPGAGTIVGAATIGAGLGFIQPTEGNESVLQNTAVGAAAGPAGIMTGRAVGAAYQGGKALVEPFTQAGRERIGGRVLQRFADDPSKIASATNRPTITGAQPTLAEQTGDAGLARLQDSLRSVDPQINNQLAGRLSDNNAARVNALRGLAGEDGGRDAAVAARQATARQQYGDAFKVNPASNISPADQQTVAALLKRPAIQEAAADARVNATNAGKALDPEGSIEGMHQMKLAMDDAISKLKDGTAAQQNKAASIKSAQRDLMAVMERISPEYATARQTYAQMSQPVNSFDIGAQVARKGLSNGNDLSGNPTINRNALMGALRDEPALMRQATGRNVGNALSDVMKPDDLNMLRAIASESDRAGAVATAGNGPGSATAQRMAAQNILKQLVGPTGLPESWAESALANTLIGKPFNLLYGGVAEPKIQQALAQAVMDPAKAQAMLAAATPAQRSRLVELFSRASAARVNPAAQALTNRPSQ